MALCGALSLAFAVHAETISIECEAFDDWGGWVNDTQFMDQMGSPYLLAHGLGRPVADAKTSFEVKEGGAYTVWARTRNWTANWGELAAGIFSVVIDGQALGEPLGMGEAGWRFVKVGTLTLAPGKHALALHDLTGFDGRCDAIVLSNVPVSESRLNVRLHPFAAGPDKVYDLCVVGGGIGGICTAVSAARLGLKVALVHDRPILGGNNSSEVRVHLGAWQNMPPYPRLGDVLAEFGPPTGGNAEPATNYFDEAKMRIVKAEKNIDLFLNEHVSEAQTDGRGRITAVSSFNTRTGARRRFAAKWFADCTGDGTVGFLAKADYRMGRETRGETGEPWAPATADMLTMGASVQWRAKKADRPVPFFIRPWMIRFTDENGHLHLKGDWDWEAGLGRDQLKDAEYIRDYGLLVAYSNWAYVKNVASNRAEFVDKELEWVAYNAGRRETRRLMGDFILSEKHIQDRDFQPDGTCAATWTIDLHFPKTAAETKFGGEPFKSNSENETIWPYPIPYRCY